MYSVRNIRCRIWLRGEWAEKVLEMMTAGKAGRAAAPTMGKRKRRGRVSRPREYNKIIVSALLWCTIVYVQACRINIFIHLCNLSRI